MLKIYDVTLDLAGDAARYARVIGRWDSDLARQLRRAAASVALNCAEGFYSQGRRKGSRYYDSMGSAREVLACLEVAERMKYIKSIDSVVKARVRQIIGTMFRLTQRFS